MKYQGAIVFKLSHILLFLLLTSNFALAGVTISGTRIVFPGAEREQTVRTTNKGDSPLLVQVWVDDGEKNDDINKVKIPFTVTPPVYRIEPGKGQSVRLIYNGMALPQDRESIFWFNLLEIPPLNEKLQDTDRLELAFRTRIKIFYRPASLKSSSVQDSDRLQWALLSPANGIKVTNPTPYYVSFDSAAMVSGKTQYPLVADMVPPFSSKTLFLENKANTVAAVSYVTARIINDYGSVIEYQLDLSGNKLTIKKPQ